MSELTQHIKMHSKLGVPATDADGNLLAHVAPRIDTLANLLLVTDAGDGEVATVSDESALVVYRGNPSVPEVYVLPVETAYFKTASDFNSTTLATGVESQVVISSALFDSHSLVNVVANTFVQQIVKSTDTGALKKIGIDLYISMLVLSLPADITQLKVTVEMFDGAIWAGITIFATHIFDVTEFTGAPYSDSFTMKVPGSIAATAADLRIVASHDSASSFNASFEIEGTLLNRFGGGYVLVP